MWARSVQATPPEVVGNDDVGDGVEHHLDVSCICGAGHVTVDFLIWRAVLALELCLDVSCGVLVDVGSWRRRRREKKNRFLFHCSDWSRSRPAGVNSESETAPGKVRADI